MPLATGMLVARISANSDNSLFNMLGRMDMYLNLEQQLPPAETANIAKTPEPELLANSLDGSTVVPSQNDINQNEIDENKIHYRRHGRYSGYSSSESESESENDCPTCFEEISDEGIHQSYGKKHHRHGHSKYIDEQGHVRKGDVGEMMMGDGPLRSDYGRHGRSSHRGGGNFGGGSPGFSIDFNDFHKKPNARHYETKSHRHRHSRSNYDDYDDYSSDDDFSDDYSDESEEEQYPEEAEPLAVETPEPEHLPVPETDQKGLGSEEAGGQPAEPAATKRPHKHRHRHHHRHHSNKEKNEIEFERNHGASPTIFEKHRNY